MRQMKVDKLGIDLLTHDPVVILKDLEGKRYLPILIGPFEATAIALALRMQAPIFVSDKIALEETVPDKRAEHEEIQRFRKFIEELKPSDFKD